MNKFSLFRILFAGLILCPIFFPPSLTSAKETSQQSTYDTLLGMSLEELIEISIATRSPMAVRKAPAIATVITAREIRNMGARNLLDIFRGVPGLGVSIAAYPVYHTIEVRGIKTLNSEKILIMIDGHSINEAMHSSSAHFFQYMSADHIKRVEIIRGPGSALYGANAFVAVINIVTKDTDDLKGLQVSVEGGSFDTQRYNALFGYGGNKLKISGHFDYLDTDGPSSFIKRDAAGASGDTLMWQKRVDAGINVTYGDFRLRGGYVRNKMGPYIGGAFALNDETVQEWGQYFADLIFHKEIAGGLDVTARLYLDQADLNPYWELFSEGFRGIYPDGMVGNPASKHRKTGGEFTADYSLSDHLLTAGIMYEYTDQHEIRSLGNFHPVTFAPLGSLQEIAPFNREVSRDTWAVYVQDVWAISDNVSLTAGIRHDRYSDFGGATNPRAGLVWEIMKDTSVKLLYGSAFRAPSFSELYHANNPSIIGNKDLKPEKISSYEAGLEHRFFNTFTARLNYFYNDISDLISQGKKPSPTEPATYENRGRAEVQGVETELLFDFRKDKYGYINYSYQHPKDEKTGERLPDVPNHRVNAGLNIAPWKYLNANVSASWIGERPRARGDARDDLKSVTLVDMTLIAKNFWKTLEIRGSVHNLFDEDYRDPCPAPGQVPEDFPANERMFLLEARYTFN